MENTEISDIAVCCMSGGYKNVFTHGVLRAFQDSGIKAKAYAACSSSSLIAAYAAINRLDTLNLSLWEDGYAMSLKEGNQSGAMLQSIKELSPMIKDNLWKSESGRLLIATSFVKTLEASKVTQSEGARRLGQMLLINALRHKSEWKDQNLELRIFDTCASANDNLLTKENFDEVAYATTRMLHAWSIPAYINKEAYIDGSYTALCPAFYLAELGYKNILCISTENDKIRRDLFTDEEVPSQINDSTIDFIKPDCGLKELGVDFYTICGNGLDEVYNYGYEKGLDYVMKIKKASVN